MTAPPVCRRSDGPAVHARADRRAADAAGSRRCSAAGVPAAGAVSYPQRLYRNDVCHAQTLVRCARHACLICCSPIASELAAPARLQLLECQQPQCCIKTRPASNHQQTELLPAWINPAGIECLRALLTQVLDGALSDLLQHPDWEEWRSDVDRASFRPGELEAFMESHKRYKQRPVSPVTETSTAVNELTSGEAPNLAEQAHG